MPNYNTVDFYRFNDKTEDVFVEGDHFLYASAEPYDFAHFLACRIYMPIIETGKRSWVIYDFLPADTEYLSSLDPAPDDIAQEILSIEQRSRENFYAMTYDEEPSDDSNEYLVNIQVKGHLTLRIVTDDANIIDDIAQAELDNLDFGKLENIEYEIGPIEDVSGNRLRE